MRRFLALGGVALLAASLAVITDWAPAQGQLACINHPSFPNANGLTLGGDAATTNGVLRLTPAEGGKVGSAFSNQPLNLTNSQGLDTQFQFRITEPGGINDGDGATGADGFALVFVNASGAPTGAQGVGIGYDGIPNSVAIEFDTFANKGSAPGAEVNDPNGNHVGVHTKGQDPNSADEADAVAGSVNTTIPNLSDGATHTARVAYQPPTGSTPGLRIFIDNTTTPVVSLPNFNIANTINLNNGQGFLGFTSSTGSAWENHDILSWTACTTTADGTPPTTTTTTTVAGPTTTTTTTTCPTSTVGTITPNAVLPGARVTYTDNAACFAPNATLAVVYTSDPVSLGTVTADAAGRVSVTLTIPTATVNGSHTITLTGAGRTGGTHQSTATLTVTATGVLPVMGSDSGGLTPWGAALIAIGALFLVAAWRLDVRQQLRDWGFLPER